VIPKFRDLGEATAAFEATLIKQLIEASGVFKGSATAGSHVNAGLFVDVLADAVAKGGGLGLSQLLESSLDPHKKAGGPGEALGGPPFAPRGFGGPPDTGADADADDLGGVTSGFGPRIHPIDGEARFHTGVDLRAKEGTPIHAAAAGVVKRAGVRGGYGQAVEVDHGDGVSTLYAHARALGVQPGDRIEEGQALGWVGQTGKTTGPHLHFEVRVDGRPVDPKKALNAYGIRAEHTIEGHQDRR